MDRIEDVLLLLLLEALGSLIDLPVPVKKAPGLLVSSTASALALELLRRLLPLRLLRAGNVAAAEKIELALSDKRLTTARFLAILSGVIQSAQRLLVTQSNVHAIMHISKGWAPCRGLVRRRTSSAQNRNRNRNRARCRKIVVPSQRARGP